MTNAISYKGDRVIRTFDVQDKIIVGRVQDIDDIITFHGDSIAEFESRFNSAVEDHLGECAALGAAPEKPASGKMMLRIAPAVHAAALKAAARSRTSLNKWAETARSKAARPPGTRSESRNDI